MGVLHYEQTLGNQQLKDKLAESTRLIRNSAKEAQKEGDAIGDAFSKAGKYITGAFSIAGISAFVSKVYQVRSYFQDIESSMKLFLGSEEKALAFTKQLKDYAWYNMFEFSELADASKQLIAYKNNVKDVIPIIDQLSNIATGTKAPLMELVYLYNKAKSIDRVDARDMQSWGVKGVVIKDVLKEMGIEADKSGISFEKLNLVLKYLTDEGGMFHDQMKAQMNNLSAEWGQFKDNLSYALNEIGEKMQGAMTKGIKSLAWAVDNYEQLGRVVMDLIAVYGSYKAAVLVAHAAEKMMYQYKLASMAAETAGITTTKVLTDALKLQTKAWLANAKAIMANPYVWLGAAVAAVVFVTYKLITAKSAEERAQEKLNKRIEEYNERQAEEKSKADEAFRVMKDSTATAYDKVRAYNDLIARYPELLAKYDAEKIKLMDIATYEREVIQLTNERQRAYLVAEVERTKPKTRYYAEDFQDTETIIEEPSAEHKQAQANLWNFDRQQQQEKLDAAYEALSTEQKIAKRTEQVDALLAENELLNKQISAQTQNNAKKQTVQNLVEKGAEDNGDGSNGQNKSYTTAVDDTKGLSMQVHKNLEIIKDYKAQISTLKNAPKGTTEPTTPDDNAAKALEAYNKAKADYDKLLQKRRLQSMRDFEQAEINLMAEGTDKKLAQANLEYRKQRDAIVEQKDKMLEALRDLKEAEWNAQNPNSKDKFNRASIGYDDLSDEQKAQLEKQGEIIVHARTQAYKDAHDAEKEAMNEYLIEWGDYEQQRLAITEKYDNLIAKASTEGEKLSLKKTMERELASIDIDGSAAFQKIFKSIQSMTKSQIQNALRLADNLIKTKKNDNGEQLTDEMLAKLVERAEELKETLAEIEISPGIDTDFQSLIKRFTKIRTLKKDIAKQGGVVTDDQKEELSLQKREAALGIILNVGNAINDGLRQTAELMKEIADITGDIELSSTADLISAMSQNFAAAGQGAASGGWIGAIVGGGMDMIQQTFDAFAQNKLSMVRYKQFLIDFKRELTLNDLEVDDDKYDTIFGTNALGRAQEAYAKSQEALEKYNETVNKSFEMTAKKKGQWSWGAALFGGDWTALFNKIAGINTGSPTEVLNGILSKSAKGMNLYQQQLDALNRGLNALQGMSIRIKDRSGWAEFWGAEDKYKSLIDVAPELWDATTGEFNVENAKAFLETSTQLTDVQRKEIQNAVDLKEAYDEAMKVVEETAQDILGNVASDMTNAIWDAVENGADAWGAFQKSAAQAIKNIGQMMLQQWVIENYLNQYQDAFMDGFKSMLSTGDSSEITAVIGQMAGGLGELYPELIALAQTMWDEAEAAGVEMDSLKDSERSATAKGIQGVSAEVGDEIAGRVTAISGHTFVLQENIKLIQPDVANIKAFSKDMRDSVILGLVELQAIRANTNNLELILDAITGTQRVVEQVRDHGLTLKR